MRILSIVFEADSGPGVFAEAIRAAGAGHDIWRLPRSAPPRDPSSYDGVVVLGGSMNPDEDAIYPWLGDTKALLRDLVSRGQGVLGICLGAQLLADAMGVQSAPLDNPELGWHEVTLTREGQRDPLLGPLAPRFTAFGWHRYQFPLPPAAVALARSPLCLQAFRVDGARAWALQFHAEVTLSSAVAWIGEDRDEQDARRLGIDADAVIATTRRRITAWNDLGRGICRRFVEALASRKRLPT